MLQVEPAQVGARLDQFLAGRLGPAGHSRTALVSWIGEGRVQLVHEGQVDPAPRKGVKLEAGDRVLVRLPPPATPPGPLLPEALPVPVLYQDEALLVLDKPAGLTVHPGAGRREGTLANALLHLSPGRLSGLGGEDRPGIVHRLDRETSGVIVVARSDAAHRELARQFHDREVEKTYLALVHGCPAAPEGRIEAPIGRHPQDRKRMAPHKSGRSAESEYRLLERFARCALVEVRPRTGRTHQIRVHLAHLGHPVLADPTYGRTAPPFTRAQAALPGPDGPLLERCALHAARLTLSHPVSGARLSFEAPLPHDLQAALEALRAGDSGGPRKMDGDARA